MDNKGTSPTIEETGKGILNDGYTICFPIVEAAHCYEMKLVRAERGYNSLGISEVAFRECIILCMVNQKDGGYAMRDDLCYPKMIPFGKH